MPDDVFECHDPNGVPFSKTNNFVDRAWAMKKIKALEEENARLREAWEGLQEIIARKYDIRQDIEEGNE